MALVLAGVAFMPRFAQNPNYHLFADQRNIFGIPHFFDVIFEYYFFASRSEWVRQWKKDTAGKSERTPFSLCLLRLFTRACVDCLVAAIIIGPKHRDFVLGSPAMTLAFMSFISLMVFFRVSEVAAKKIFWPLIVIGFVSVLYWSILEARGAVT